MSAPMKQVDPRIKVVRFINIPATVLHICVTISCKTHSRIEYWTAEDYVIYMLSYGHLSGRLNRSDLFDFTNRPDLIDFITPAISISPPG